jgi:hypothetical protein
MWNNLVHEKGFVLNLSRNFGPFIEAIVVMMEGLIFKRV